MDRLHRALRAEGIDSKILSSKKTLNTSLSTKIPRSARWKKIENFIGLFTTELGLNDINYLSSFRVKGLQKYSQADILHFHGTHGHFNYLALPSLTKNKPAIFTLHDMWALTGHCTYSYDCGRWKTGCGQCPYPKIHRPIKRDNTRLEWKLKEWVYQHSNLTIVVLNKWMAEKISQSSLYHLSVCQIPNGVDVETYQPLDSEQCRSLLGIPSDKKVLMFVSLSLGNHRKGSDLLIKALQSLPVSLKSEIVLLLVGDGGEGLAQVIDLKTVDLGYVRSDRLKAIAYSAADLVVFPTRADNLPLVLQESMACGTPMVSFDVGGVPELVRPGQTGYLAKPEDAEDFKNGIVELLEDDKLRNGLGHQCRAIAVEEYSLALQVKRHIKLYKSVIQNFVNQSERSVKFQLSEI